VLHQVGVSFNSALNVSGDKLAHPQEQFLTVYTAFGTMNRYCKPTGDKVGTEIELSSISTLSPVGSNIGALYQKLYIRSKKALLRMGEFVARNM
jgi:hypothetical protein